MNNKKCGCSCNGECCESKENQNCWDFHNCSEESKKECEAFKHEMGKECWFVSHLTKGNRKCFECGWFQKFNQV